jgi:pyridoxamine 5'-phosphate oxidase
VTGDPAPGADLRTLRHEYQTHGLDARDVDPDPIVQFARWYDDAAAAGLWEPNAMVVSTVSAGGRPSARYLLLRGADARGFSFFTNYESAKAGDLDSTRVAALTFGWLELHRQVRVVGPVERLGAEESDEYFASRPFESRLGSWASPQSQVLPGREELDRRLAEARARFEPAGDVPRPAYWGGYLLRPDEIELWQGRIARLHDRLRYRRSGEGWVLERLAP